MNVQLRQYARFALLALLIGHTGASVAIASPFSPIVQATRGFHAQRLFGVTWIVEHNELDVERVLCAAENSPIQFFGNKTIVVRELLADPFIASLFLEHIHVILEPGRKLTP